MKYKIQKKFNNKLLRPETLILLLISTQNSLACVTNNNHKTQIRIYSNYQYIDIMTNTLTITGNVVININAINIYADKISITYSNKNNLKEKTINAYGNPIIFYKSEKKRNKILATSLHMSYKTSNNRIKLKEQVYLKTDKYTLQSHCITYFIKNKYIETCNDQDRLNTTIFTLNTNKNNINIQHPSITSQFDQQHK